MVVISALAWWKRQFTPYLHFVWGIAGALTWLAVAKRYLARVDSHTPPQKPPRLLFLALPAAAILSFAIGATNAGGAEWLLPPRSHSQIHVDGSNEPVSAVILLSLTDFLLVKTAPTHRVELIPKSRVRLIIQERSSPPEAGRPNSGGTRAAPFALESLEGRQCACS